MLHRSVRAAALLGVVVLVTLAWQAAAVAKTRPHLTIFSPHSWQVLQRDRQSRADLMVSGVLVGVRGRVRVSWGGRVSGARCDRRGRFTARLADVPAGQHTLRVWCAGRPAVSAERQYVGVGDIYVIAGQSNASGRSHLSYTYSSPTLKATMFGNDYRWRELQDPVDSAVGQVDRVSRDTTAGGSVWPEVATQLLAAEDVPVAFVPCARSSTPIAWWSPDLRTTKAAGTLYGSMAQRITTVGGRVRAVLWWQGERDARDLTSADAYEASLEELSADLWSRFGAPLVVAQIGDYGSELTDAAVDTVRDAQQRAWGRMHIVQGPVLYDIDLGGGVHFNDEPDVTLAARRWAAAILRGVLRRDAGRTPRLLRAELTGDEVVLTAGADLAPGADLGGFVVRVDGQDLPVVSASAEGETVKLQLAQPVAGACTVSLGEGRTAAGAAVPTDASDWRLPMVPFVGQPVADTAVVDDSGQ